MYFTQKSMGWTICRAEHGLGNERSARPQSALKNFEEKEEFMADLNTRLPRNESGPWYVDSNCIDCDLCRETAPSVFRRDEDGGYSIVFHQPETEKERKSAAEAKEGCPVEAIGDDGGAHLNPKDQGFK